MLQVISGKFFTKPNRFTHDAKAVTYSNFSYSQPIKTCIATLEPADIFHESAVPYIINYTNQIEYDEIRPGVISRIGDPEIVQQFQLLCIFGLRAFFHTDKRNVEINCRERRKNSGDYYLPSKFVKRFFDTSIRGNEIDISTFVQFVDKVIGLPRKEYTAVIRFLGNFSDALQILNYNLDLAYSMLVYSLESLSQNFDDFEATWDDYDQKIKNNLDKQLLIIDQDVATEIREILLKSSHLKLQQRFIKFITNNISDTYYLDEALDTTITTTRPIRPSEIEIALKNAYSMRSKYAHQLIPILNQLKSPQLAEGDVFPWQNSPYLTFNGLTRLAYHVINNFVQKQPYLETEEYDWNGDIHNIVPTAIVQMKMAAQYWIWNSLGFSPDQVFDRFSGFLSHFIEAILDSKNTDLIDLHELLELYETSIANAKRQQKIAMLSMYLIYNQSLIPELQMKNHVTFIKKHIDILNECCIETMLVNILCGKQWNWDIHDCVFQYSNKYIKRKFTENALNLPFILELCVIFEIANSYLRIGSKDEYYKWMQTALLESCGNQSLQSYIQKNKSDNLEINCASFFEWLRSSNIK
ncbi:hypothetical protein H6G54_16035 [Anabaena cylindrica FACHB-243]|uniref:Uncharacterized protein n=1 Tax=Anabaena cylindrica (strain ATCC 27899 / PCC 7122) TaxID=272123 RepID=K9ZI72_ANACC|nr:MULTISPECIES: hypothetical protein [Anabaena]AFZ58045.1 hypothetical protein Anacy_2603 [Anabaena cylindrica PCC 7122]MBD2419180.1 hypothetical protein [Anabaena cylindrica FACHB-243]MBY5283999.1 hypothetical protein [Anabaena sp. CCAP 1446/1C]MBY5306864.1 hypothetical protein [Anabaena sp. CCAP 1446/1C]MCM2409652.1 hypothetical protein [Anabaena sp. CCAP 1446/1C]